MNEDGLKLPFNREKELAQAFAYRRAWH